MDEREAIALNIQLPVASLDGFTRLVEQLRCLAAELKSGGVAAVSSVPVHPVESGRNPSFDLHRFQAFRDETETGQAAANGEVPEQETDSGLPHEPAGEPGAARERNSSSAGERMGGGPSPYPSLNGAGWEISSPDAPAAAEWEIASPETLATAGWEVSPLDDPAGDHLEISGIHDPSIAEVPTFTDAIHAQRYAALLSEMPAPVDSAAPGSDLSISAPEEKRPAATAEPPAIEERSDGMFVPEVQTIVTDPMTVSGDIALSQIETPPAAEYRFSPMRESSGFRRGSEETATLPAGGHSLTAREVSRAFQRDGRRYDNGFQLY